MSTSTETPEAGRLNLIEAASRLGVSEVTVRRYIRLGRLPARRNPSRRLTVRVEDVVALADGEPVAARTAPRPTPTVAPSTAPSTAPATPRAATASPKPLFRSQQ